MVGVYSSKIQGTYMNINKILPKIFKHMEDLGLVWISNLMFGLRIDGNALVFTISNSDIGSKDYILMYGEDNEAFLKKFNSSYHFPRLLKAEIKFLIGTGQFSLFVEKELETKDGNPIEVGLVCDDLKKDFEIHKDFDKFISQIESESTTELLKMWHERKGHKMGRFMSGRVGYLPEDLHFIERSKSWSSIVKSQNKIDLITLNLPNITLSSLAMRSRDIISDKMKLITESLAQLRNEMGVIQTQT